MYVAYIDESGDSGLGAGSSRTYILSCVFVRSSHWLEAFDGLIGFRRFLKKELGVPMHAEIKANSLLKNTGDFKDLELSEHARHFIYKGLLRLQPKLGLSAFAVVINKSGLYGAAKPFDTAWTFMLQRLERLSTNESTEIMLIHDEGEPLRIRKLARKSRRFGTAGSMFGGHLNVPFKGLLDDSISRSSKQSYFLQLADLNAYAAFRRIYPPPAGIPRRRQIVPQLMWEELGDARFQPANGRAGGPSAGIVYWPK